MLNSPLREAPRNQRAVVIPLQQESSILEWLQNSGRMIAREAYDQDYPEDQEEIDSLIGAEDGISDFDFDDDDDAAPEEE
ncbi:DUF3134 domain-containing protein [Calothrix sp. 336/3]|jgi:Protein of unknown function (DUF3134)|uniref:DUF3134 domain-containing protein n=1 Tax=Calothrix sp. 336/3 TaxID=1337936 RepID=UPI0004E44AD2|nr:DUF3134 domain-containing protein [Calothrix sp. 336/3]AKG23160.1 hypothetical protein IJ00_19460 [Calothrix sp. 336/3]